MEVRNKATSINLFSLRTRQMRAFHMSWFSFFLCFFAWFGIALLIKGVNFILNDMSNLEARLGDLGPGQTMIAWSVVLAHCVGGAAMALGFTTRVAAAANAIILLGAVVVTSKASEGGNLLGAAGLEFQFALLVFITLVLFVWRGSGPLSLDHLMQMDDDEEPEMLGHTPV